MKKKLKVKEQQKEMAKSVKGKVSFKKQSAVKSHSQNSKFSNDTSELNLTKPCNLTIQSDERFYRILFSDSNWHKMKFPPLFVRRFGNDIDSTTTATLVVPSGGSWTASVSHEGDIVYLKRGWEEFLKDNLVREYELLTFAYLGNMKFLVRVFDISGLERMSVIIPETKKPTPTVDKKCDSGKVKRKKIAKETETEDMTVLPAPTNISISETKKSNLIAQKKCNSGKIKRKSNSGKNEQKKRVKTELEDMIILPAPMNINIPETKKPFPSVNKNIDRGKIKRKKIPKETEMEDMIILPAPTNINISETMKPNRIVHKECDWGICKQNSYSTKKEQKKIKKETEEEEEDMIILPAPTPFFAITIETYHISKEGYAIVPDAFAEKYLTGANVNGRLVVGGWSDFVQFGNENDKWVIRRGWSEFSSGNNLKLMDTCVFELVDPEKLIFKVSFGRRGRRRNV